MDVEKLRRELSEILELALKRVDDPELEDASKSSQNTQESNRWSATEDLVDLFKDEALQTLQSSPRSMKVISVTNVDPGAVEKPEGILTHSASGSRSELVAKKSDVSIKRVSLPIDPKAEEEEQEDTSLSQASDFFRDETHSTIVEQTARVCACAVKRASQEASRESNSVQYEEASSQQKNLGAIRKQSSKRFLTFNITYVDIEELPLRRRDKAINQPATTVLSMTDMIQPGKTEAVQAAKKKLEDDDGFMNLPAVPSDEMSKVSSSAWIDENVSFMVEKEESKAYTKVSLGRSAPKATSKVQDPDADAAAQSEPQAGVEKRDSKLRKCQCLLKRVSKLFRKSKE